MTSTGRLPSWVSLRPFRATDTRIIQASAAFLCLLAIPSEAQSQVGRTSSPPAASLHCWQRGNGLLFTLFCVFGVTAILVESRKKKGRTKALTFETSMPIRLLLRQQHHELEAADKHKGSSSISPATFDKPLRKLTSRIF
ncbi:hypothetical protein HPP92_022644 [Vanilla planifolia]|uniref:Uncharacterized protein n=1 Tax=Vanilla planifolia TaxID=51239 RepID=A0A835PSJ3_VANPL|nr:hypothetical protein HPP92_022926 [Vanilla planifolia]KAG0459516.1 hypothetical protein HPP92_022644 [Vanilla planifolia]